MPAERRWAGAWFLTGLLVLPRLEGDDEAHDLSVVVVLAVETDGGGLGRNASRSG